MASVNDRNYLRRTIGGRVLVHQEEAYNAIQTSRRLGETKALVKMFCGTGKSRVIYKDICDTAFGLSVVVFPKLSLG